MKYKEFYTHLLTENQLAKTSTDHRVTTRFRRETDWDVIDNIQQNYERYANRAGIHPTLHYKCRHVR